MKDSKGGSVPAVVVLNGGETTMRWTDQNGRLAFTGLNSGKYQLAFCAIGFYPELRNIRVKLGRPTRVRVRLRVSGDSLLAAKK